MSDQRKLSIVVLCGMVLLATLANTDSSHIRAAIYIAAVFILYGTSDR